MKLFIAIGLVSAVILSAGAEASVESARKSPVKICKDTDVSSGACFANRVQIAESFILRHEIKTARSALLIHGLTDSPYSMKDLAKAIFDSGMNVVAIRLSGHGTRPEDLHSVKIGDWIDDTRYGVELASRLGDKVVLVGYSTGGVLATIAVQKKIVPAARLSGLVLLAPAFDIGAKASLTCLLPNFWAWGDDGNAEDWLPAKYRRGSSNGVCQLVHAGRLAQSGESFEMPVLTVVTANDQTIDSYGALTFAQNISDKKSETIVLATDETQARGLAPLASQIGQGMLFIRGSEPVTHAGLTLERNDIFAQSNSSFVPMKNEILLWIDRIK
jgi:esterase/lipase